MLAIRRASAAVFFMLCALPGAAHGQAAPKTVPAALATSAPTTNANAAAIEAEIDGLLAQLASDDWPARMAAQNRLAAMRDLAEPRLTRAARESDDAEVRARADAALHQIAETRLAGPTLITMRVFDVHPRIAFDELARQAGTEFKPQVPSLWTQQLPPVTLDVQREPLWEVVRRLREQCKLDVAPGSTGFTITQVPPGADKAPTVVSGAFRVRATRVSRSYAVDLTSGGVAQNEFLVQLALQPEPKLKINGGTPLVKLEAAEDENGLSLLPGSGADGGGGGAGVGAGAAAAAGPVPAVAAARVQNPPLVRGRVDVGIRHDVSPWPVEVRLAYPAQGAGKRIARLKGSAACTVVVRTETIEIPDVLKAANVTKQAGGSSLTVRSCRKVGQQYELSVSLAGDAAAAGPQVFGIRNPNQTSIRLLDSTGRELLQQGTRRITSTSHESTHVTLSFAAGPAPLAAAAVVKLVWQVPSEMRDVEVPFEFTDLPLP